MEIVGKPVTNTIALTDSGRGIEGVLIKLHEETRSGSYTWEVRRGCGQNPQSCEALQSGGRVCGRQTLIVDGRSMRDRSGAVYCGYTESSEESLSKAGYIGE